MTTLWPIFDPFARVPPKHQRICCHGYIQILCRVQTCIDEAIRKAYPYQTPQQAMTANSERIDRKAEIARAIRTLRSRNPYATR